MKQGGLKMYAPWVIWLIAFVKMIYLYAQYRTERNYLLCSSTFYNFIYICADCSSHSGCIGQNGLFSEEQGLQQKRTQTVSHSYDPDTACSTAFLRSGIFAG